VEPIHVAAFVEAQLHSRPTVKQRRGKTPVLQANEARALIDAIDTDSLPGLRDRALIGLMVYTFARVGAAVSMKLEDYFVQASRGWVRLHEMPAHHNLDRYLEEYIAAAGIAQDKKGPLFRTTKGRSGELIGNPLLQSDVWRMILRRAKLAGLETEIGCHTFRATGISKTAPGSKSRSRWPITKERALPASTTGAATRSVWMKWRGLRFDSDGYGIRTMRRKEGLQQKWMKRLSNLQRQKRG
jgi:integrase